MWHYLHLVHVLLAHLQFWGHDTQQQALPWAMDPYTSALSHHGTSCSGKEQVFAFPLEATGSLPQLWDVLWFSIGIIADLQSGRHSMAAALQWSEKLHTRAAGSGDRAGAQHLHKEEEPEQRTLSWVALLMRVTKAVGLSTYSISATLWDERDSPALRAAAGRRGKGKWVSFCPFML